MIQLKGWVDTEGVEHPYDENQKMWIHPDNYYASFEGWTHRLDADGWLRPYRKREEPHDWTVQELIDKLSGLTEDQKTYRCSVESDPQSYVSGISVDDERREVWIG